MYSMYIQMYSKSNGPLRGSYLTLFLEEEHLQLVGLSIILSKMAVHCQA